MLNLLSLLLMWFSKRLSYITRVPFLYSFFLLFPIYFVGIGCVNSPIQLDSTPQNLSTVISGQSLIFTCMTTGSTIIAWSSIEYINRGGSQLTFLSINNPGMIKSISNSGNFAILTKVDRANQVLKSQLHLVNVTVMSTVICYNNDQGVNATITFSVGKKFMIMQAHT